MDAEPTPPALVAVMDTDRCGLLHGDSSQLGTVLAPNSIDSLCTDPPAGIGFMAKGWDDDKGGRDGWIAWLTEILRVAYVAMKPGAHGLVWAIPRTSHWTATACENAGFEIRDVVMHLFGTGFPKSLNLGEGRGTALKPAAEHWILIRKPLEGTYVANLDEHGVGALNIDACRIGENPGYKYNADRNGSTFHGEQGERHEQSAAKRGAPTVESSQGRWPANLTLDEEAAAILDEQSGTVGCGNASAAPARTRDTNTTAFAMAPGKRRAGKESGASRFFYVAKGSRSEKDEGLDHLPVKSGGEATDREDGSAGLKNPRAGAGRTGGARNHHPTVKSIALMRWLVRLITPPGGTVLDPFAGSGTTGIAALAEGCSFIGVERESEYLPITVGRLQHAIATYVDSGNTVPSDGV